MSMWRMTIIVASFSLWLMQTAFPVLSKQKMPVIPFQVSASPEKKRIFFFPLGLFSPPFYRQWNRKRRECS